MDDWKIMFTGSTAEKLEYQSKQIAELKSDRAELESEVKALREENAQKRETTAQYKNATELAMEVYPFKIDGTKLEALLDKADE